MRSSLTCAATAFAVQEAGQVPPGNNKDNDTWTPKRPQKGEIKLTPGKGVQDLNCSITDLIGQVVKANKVALQGPCSSASAPPPLLKPIGIRKGTSYNCNHMA